jgi:predicted HAD superfamily Cof-like phosphohydrolase
MYKGLIAEEFSELEEAHDMEAELDALIDILVVTIGAIHSAGFDAEGAWKEVMRTNFAKIDKDTGKVRKREDGKVLKPVGWTPPDLKSFLRKNPITQLNNNPSTSPKGKSLADRMREAKKGK